MNAQRRKRSRTLAEDPAAIVEPDDTLAVSGIRALPDGRTIAVTVKRKTVARIDAGDADELRLTTGLPWTADLAESLHRLARSHAARTHALRLTAARARTSRDLIRRLTIAGHAQADATSAAEALADAGIINDDAFAESAAASLAARRDTSRRGIERKLIAKGVDRSAAAAAAAEHRTAEHDADTAINLAAARVGRLRSIDDPTATRRRLVAYLQRRGFSLDDCFRAVDAALADRAAGEEHTDLD